MCKISRKYILEISTSLANAVKLVKRVVGGSLRALHFPTYMIQLLGKDFDTGIASYQFEIVNSLLYLRTRLTGDNILEEEIKHRITVGNKCLNGLLKQIMPK